MYDNHRKSEHLIASDTNARALWMEGLQYLMKRHSGETQGELMQDKE